MRTSRIDFARTPCAWSTAVVPSGFGNDLVFRAALEGRELREAFDLRQVVFQERSDYLIGAHAGLHAAEDPHDAVAHHFACRLGGETIAAMRFSVALDGSFEAEELAELPTALGEVREDLFQVSRLVVREDLRKRYVTEVMVQLACRWLAEHVSIRSYFALCLPRLAAFYEHFGAEIVTREPLVVPERRGHEYLWIRGETARTAATVREYLGALGWDLARIRVGDPSRT